MEPIDPADIRAEDVVRRVWTSRSIEHLAQGRVYFAGLDFSGFSTGHQKDRKLIVGLDGHGVFGTGEPDVQWFLVARCTKHASHKWMGRHWVGRVTVEGGAYDETCEERS